MPKPASDFVKCVDCDRGFYGRDEDKCSSGWNIKKRSMKGKTSGCFLGTRIESEKP